MTISRRKSVEAMAAAVAAAVLPLPTKLVGAYSEVGVDLGIKGGSFTGLSIIVDPDDGVLMRMLKDYCRARWDESIQLHLVKGKGRLDVME